MQRMTTSFFSTDINQLHFSNVCNVNQCSLEVSCSVNHSLIKTTTLLLDALPQFVHILDLVIVNAFLLGPSHRTVDGVWVGLCGLSLPVL